MTICELFLHVKVGDFLLSFIKKHHLDPKIKYQKRLDLTPTFECNITNKLISQINFSPKIHFNFLMLQLLFQAF